MTFINKIKELSVINEIIEKEEFGDISPIINNRQKIIDNLPNSKTEINYNNKKIDLKLINDKDYLNLLKDINFKKVLRLHFKKNSQYRQEVLKTFSAKKWLQNRYVITNLFKKINTLNHQFKKTIVYEMNGRLDKDINQLTSDSEKVKEMTVFLEKNGYTFPIFEIGGCYKGKTIFSIKEAFEEIKKLYIHKKEIVNKIDEYIENMKKVYDNQYKIVFSLETRKVASQSTNVNWRSCMNLVNGENRHFVGSSIANGLAVVYLTRVGDYLKINRPLGRLLIKPMVSEEKIANKTKASDLTSGDIYYHLENLYTTDKYIVNKRITDNFTVKVKEIIDNVNDAVSIDIVNKETDINKQERKFILNKGEEKNYYKDTIDEINVDASYSDLLKKVNQNLDLTSEDEEKLKNILNKIEEKNKSKKEKNKSFFLDGQEALNPNFVNALLKNKKYDYLFKKYNIPVETDTFLIKRIPDIKSIKSLKLNAISKSIVIDSEEKNKEIKIEELYYKPINGGDNNLSKISDDSIVNVKKFQYEFNPRRGGDFKIKSNLKALKIPKEFKKEINKKEFIFKDYSDYDSKVFFKPENYKDIEKLKEDDRFKIKIDKSFDKDISYGFLGCEIEFERRTDNERKSFNVIMDHNSVITKFPEKYYLNYVSFNSFNHDTNLINDQAGFFYKSLFELIINFQANYLLKYFKNENKLEIKKLNEIIFSKNFKITEQLTFLNNFINDTEAKNDFFKQLKKLIPTDIFFTMTVNISDDNLLNYLKNKSKVKEEPINEELTNDNFKYQMLKNDFYTYLVKIKNICTIFSINFTVIDNSYLNTYVYKDLKSIINIKPDNYDGEEDFKYKDNIDFMHISNATKEVKLNKNIKYLIIDNKTENDGKIIYSNDEKTETVFIENCNLKELVINAEIKNLEIKDSNIDSISYGNGFYYKEVSITKSEIKKINVTQSSFSNTYLNVTNCTSLPEKIIFRKIIIWSSNLNLTNVLTKEIEFVHSNVKKYENINILESYEKFQEKIYIKYISNDAFIDNFPIYIKNSENNDAMKKLLNNDKNIIFIDDINNVNFNDQLENIIVDQILLILKIKDKKTFDRDFIENLYELKSNLPERIKMRLFESPALEWFIQQKNTIIEKAKKKKEEKIKEIKKAKPIGSKIKELKKRFLGDSFVSSINHLENQSYFD
jgi:hypothetical protein